LANEHIDKHLGEFGPVTLTREPVNCAMKTMCLLGCEKDAVLAAGFAGGLGLKGNVCGALAAGILAIGLRFYRRRRRRRDSALKAMLQEAGVGKDSSAAAMPLLDNFRRKYATLLCSHLTGRTFSSIDDHSAFIADGGCCDVISSVFESAKDVR
jgi:hypothetical protein